MRDKSAFTAMRAHFSDKIRTDTMTPAWLPQNQLQAWLNKAYKAEKQKRLMARSAETRMANSAQSNPPPASHKGACKRNQLKAPAPKGKAKKPCLKETSSSEESGDEEGSCWDEHEEIEYEGDSK